ncbi:ribosomal RNA small subunit methyltransferase A [Patescibacteria group bacterium]|nr:ribosomal RNA small subunit methyltransferase A [Patescibacteria group bacterium]
MDRSNPQDIVARLRAEGAWSKKSLGQHFLVDRSALDDILTAADLTVKDTVIEIGPGLGVLSERLLEQAGRVIALEYDPDMVRILRQDFPNLELIEGDALQTLPAAVAGINRYLVVANIPYQITTPLLRLLLEGQIQPQPERIVLLVQKEVGVRLTAAAGKPGRGYLSVLCQLYAETEYIHTVPAASFWPPPKVDSAIITLQRRAELPLTTEEMPAFLRFVHTFFIQPRKQLKNVIAGIRRLPAAEVADRFIRLEIPLTARAQELTQEQWLRLYQEAI